MKNRSLEFGFLVFQCQNVWYQCLITVNKFVDGFIIILCFRGIFCNQFVLFQKFDTFQVHKFVDKLNMLNNVFKINDEILRILWRCVCFQTDCEADDADEAND